MVTGSPTTNFTMRRLGSIPSSRMLLHRNHRPLSSPSLLGITTAKRGLSETIPTTIRATTTTIPTRCWPSTSCGWDQELQLKQERSDKSELVDPFKTNNINIRNSNPWRNARLLNSARSAASRWNSIPSQLQCTGAGTAFWSSNNNIHHNNQYIYTSIRCYYETNKSKKLRKQIKGSKEGRQRYLDRLAGIVEEEPPPPPPEPTPRDSRYLVVRHGDAYEKQMESFHGMTLQKAQREAKGMEDPLFDPFMEDELMERQLMEEEMAEQEAAEQEAAERELMISDGKQDASESKDEEDKEAEDDDENDDDEYDEEDEEGVELTEEEKTELTPEELACIMYNADGSLRRKPSQKQVLKAGFPAGGIYGVVEMAGTQFKVTHDDLIICNRLDTKIFTVGSIHALPEVLLVGTTHFTLVGLPYVTGATVHVMVEEITMDKKVIIFKHRPRKHSQRKRGFRRDVTMLRVLDIQFPADFNANEEEKFVPRIEPELLPPRRNPRKRFQKHGQKEEEGEEELGDAEEVSGTERAA
ncbi:hypothetical protein ACA910_001464 [Epithemia clementina (nom. ined.)]